MTLRVLFPLGGTDLSWRAFERGLELLKPMPGLLVTALNVHQPGFESAREDTVREFEAHEEEEIFPDEEASRRVLARAVEIGAKHGVRVEGLSLEGAHYETILREAPKHDLLMMHELSASGFRDHLKGSRTEDLARHAKTSVLLVRCD
jgi:nucleotide-binding universal stress UspA family protein